MQERINWIDWAKVIAIAFVVFGHVPQPVGSLPIGYICTFHMPLFFMLSGYLAKGCTDIHRNIRKHWHSLVLPYILYNMIFYPYWLLRHILEGGDISAVDVVLKPFLGVIFLQIETPYSTTVSGVTWFLAALLAMRIALNMIYRSKHELHLMLLSSLVVAVLYVVNESNHTFNNLFTVGFLNCYPFYIIGHLLAKFKILDRMGNRNGSVCFLLVSVAIFLFANSYTEWKGITTSYLIALTGSLGVIYVCRMLNSYTSSLLVTLSTGTIAIMGLHWMIIGTMNYVVEKLFGLSKVIYVFPIALMLTIAIMMAIYPFILLCSKYWPGLLGK